MSHAPHRPAPRPVGPRPLPTAAASQLLPKLSIRELIAELSQVEESLRALPALLDRADELVPDPAVQSLLQREHAIVDELTARRRRRGLIAAPLVREGAPLRTPPPWR